VVICYSSLRKLIQPLIFVKILLQSLVIPAFCISNVDNLCFLSLCLSLFLPPPQTLKMSVTILLTPYNKKLLYWATGSSLSLPPQGFITFIRLFKQLAFDLFFHSILKLFSILLIHALIFIISFLLLSLCSMYHSFLTSWNKHQVVHCSVSLLHLFFFSLLHLKPQIFI